MPNGPNNFPPPPKAAFAPPTPKLAEARANKANKSQIAPFPP